MAAPLRPSRRSAAALIGTTGNAVEPARQGAVVTVEETDALEIEHLTVRFGGNVALDDVALRAPRGRITGLIGPNGAGKTTLFNACSGVVKAAVGRIAYAGRDITDASPSHRAQLGLGRTFQRMELFDSMDVRANVALGREAVLAGSHPVRHLWCRRPDAIEIERRTDHALRLCGIESIAGSPVASLSTGQRRLVELARCVAAGRSLLLLDEPSSGLDHSETARFGAVLRGLVDSEGLGILLVEHDMALVMSTCEHLFVLDFGRLLFSGTADEVRSSALVKRAYLGEEV